MKKNVHKKAIYINIFSYFYLSEKDYYLYRWVKITLLSWKRCDYDMKEFFAAELLNEQGNRRKINQ